MFILLLVGLVFVQVGFTVSSLGFLVTIGAWILIVVVYYDRYRTEKKWRQKKSSSPS